MRAMLRLTAARCWRALRGPGGPDRPRNPLQSSFCLPGRSRSSSETWRSAGIWSRGFTGSGECHFSRCEYKRLEFAEECGDAELLEQVGDTPYRRGLLRSEKPCSSGPSRGCALGHPWRPRPREERPLLSTSAFPYGLCISAHRSSSDQSLTHQSEQRL